MANPASCVCPLYRMGIDCGPCPYRDAPAGNPYVRDAEADRKIAEILDVLEKWIEQLREENDGFEPC